MDGCRSCGQQLPHSHAADDTAPCWFCRELAADDVLRAAWDSLAGEGMGNALARMGIEAARTKHVQSA